LSSSESWAGFGTLSRDLVEALLFSIVLALFTRTFLFQAFEIPSPSMEGNLLVGDHILVNKFVYGPAPTRIERTLLPVRSVARGDVVVFRYPVDPSRDFIKRCVALGGDHVEISNRRLWLNGRALDESAYVFHDDEAQGDPFARYESRPLGDFGPFSVPRGSYFCLGDNRENSHDSRAWGPVLSELVRGRALLIYWSRGASLEEEEITLTRGSRGLRRVQELATSTRWGRTFRLVR
jgi:signal peptidase I